MSGVHSSTCQRVRKYDSLGWAGNGLIGQEHRPQGSREIDYFLICYMFTSTVINFLMFHYCYYYYYYKYYYYYYYYYDYYYH